MKTKAIKVAAGVVVDEAGRVLVAKRPNHKHQGGLWEFPGGKIELGESTHEALARELDEEVGIQIIESQPLIRIWHQYTDKQVCLDVLRVTGFHGNAWGREGQEIAWVSVDDLLTLEFPAANVPIVAATRLPRTLMITGQFESQTECLERLQFGLAKNPGMVQFRAPWLNEATYIQLAKKAHFLCQRFHVPMMANCSVEAYHQILCEGLHLTAARLHASSSRPVDTKTWLSAACHTELDIEHARQAGIDFVTLSPVLPTTSHPGQPAMGWQKFALMAENAPLPVFALGGMALAHVDEAVESGAQGIAAIGAYHDE